MGDCYICRAVIRNGVFSIPIRPQLLIRISLSKLINRGMWPYVAMARTLETDTDRIYEQIVTEIAALDGREPTELPPLFNAVDPDALTAIFSPTEAGATRTGRVQFPYAGYDVRVEFEDVPVLTID